jgi:DNA-directed RNA polymerase specialized sigma24 family protein
MDAANDNRPAAYDRQMVEHIPLMKKIAGRYGMKDREEFVQELCKELMLRWAEKIEAYRFSTWVWANAFNVRSRLHRASSAKMRCAPTVSVDQIGDPACQPNQDDIVELAQVIRRMSGTRDSEVLLRHAVGEDLAEIGRDYGVGRERARQLCERERKRLRAA